MSDYLNRPSLNLDWSRALMFSRILLWSFTCAHLRCEVDLNFVRVFRSRNKTAAMLLHLHSSSTSSMFTRNF